MCYRGKHNDFEGWKMDEDTNPKDHGEKDNPSLTQLKMETHEDWVIVTRKKSSKLKKNNAMNRGKIGHQVSKQVEHESRKAKIFWMSMGFNLEVIVEAFGHVRGIWILKQEKENFKVNVVHTMEQAIIMEVNEFNEVVSPKEVGGCFFSNKAERMIDMIDEYGFIDAGAVGLSFT
ncbi:hypothetical protein RJT34_14254 [Clitoria ternatea]|uniref:Uncharacterized protein n=1 Tax=Clitoria ternatea TaxID=43366 RepID=A0AAN9PM90_CLITE